MELKVDPSRAHDAFDDKTGIFVRAKRDSGFVNADIAELDLPSLVAWLRSRGGKNEWAESCVAMLLGHEIPKDGLPSPEPQKDQR